MCSMKIASIETIKFGDIAPFRRFNTTREYETISSQYVTEYATHTEFQTDTNSLMTSEKFSRDIHTKSNSNGEDPSILEEEISSEMLGVTSVNKDDYYEYVAEIESEEDEYVQEEKFKKKKKKKVSGEKKSNGSGNGSKYPVTFLVKPARKPSANFVPDFPPKAYSHPYKYDMCLSYPIELSGEMVKFKLKATKSGEYIDTNLKGNPAILIQKENRNVSDGAKEETRSFRVVFQVCSFHYQKSSFVLEVHFGKGRKKEIIFRSSEFEMFARKNKKTDSEWPNEEESKKMREEYSKVINTPLLSPFVAEEEVGKKKKERKKYKKKKKKKNTFIEEISDLKSIGEIGVRPTTRGRRKRRERKKVSYYEPTYKRHEPIVIHEDGTISEGGIEEVKKKRKRPKNITPLEIPTKQRKFCYLPKKFADYRRRIKSDEK